MSLVRQLMRVVASVIAVPLLVGCGLTTSDENGADEGGAAGTGSTTATGGSGGGTLGENPEVGSACEESDHCRGGQANGLRCEVPSCDAPFGLCVEATCTAGMKSSGAVCTCDGQISALDETCVENAYAYQDNMGFFACNPASESNCSFAGGGAFVFVGECNPERPPSGEVSMRAEGAKLAAHEGKSVRVVDLDAAGVTVESGKVELTLSFPIEQAQFPRFYVDNDADGECDNDDVVLVSESSWDHDAQTLSVNFAPTTDLSPPDCY